MAIDDNTVYGLTGAQVKELPEKINAVKGLAKELTADDYNANSSNWSDTDPTNFNCVALWKLEPGMYHKADSGVDVRTGKHTYETLGTGETVLIGKNGIYGIAMFILTNSVANNGVNYARTVTTSTDGYQNPSLSYGLFKVVDNLTSSYLLAPLSANQGKVLKDLVDSLAIRGAGAPTTSTVGQVGTLYEDTTNGNLYQLKSIDTTVTPNTYTWEAVGGGSSYTAGDGIDITNDVISATNTGKTRVLTTDDYDYPDANPTGVALWRLEPGSYLLPSGVQGYTQTYFSTPQVAPQGTYLITNGLYGNVLAAGLYVFGATTSPQYYVTRIDNGSRLMGQTLYTTVVDNLNSSSIVNALSANQGKILKDMIDANSVATFTTNEWDALWA